MRLIDVDALKDRLQEALEFQEKHYNYEGAELFEIAKDIADEQPTIDAIPVEWLRSQLKNNPNDIESAYDDICINELIDRWQKEQEGNDD